MRRGAIAAIVAVSIAAAPAAIAESGGRRSFERLKEDASKAQQAGDWSKAEQLWTQAHAVAPDALSTLHGLADATARLGRADDAFAWLDEAYGDGAVDPWRLSDDTDLAGLHADPRWEPTLERFQKARAEFIARYDARVVPLDPQAAPSFKSFRKLAAEFDRRGRALDDDRWRLSPAARSDRSSALREERIAALTRYIAEHPSASDRERAAWNTIETRVSSRPVFALRWSWGDYGTQVIESIDAFLSDYPESPHRGEAEIDRAFIAFNVRVGGDAASDASVREAAVALDRTLAEVLRKYPGTTAGGSAATYRLYVANEFDTGLTDDEVSALVTELDRQAARDRSVQRTQGQFLAGMKLLHGTLDGFHAVDLSGKTWTAASFAGKVTLIDFWATWCGPCVAEIPNVRSAWSKYGDRGLQILGVSLDFDDRKAFEAWLAQHDVAWPQAWDGGGFGTPMARKFDVRGIPQTILVDRSGRVASVGLRGVSLLSRIDRLLGADAPPAAEN